MNKILEVFKIMCKHHKTDINKTEVKQIFNIVKLENIHQIRFVKILYVKIEVMNCRLYIVKLGNIKFLKLEVLL